MTNALSLGPPQWRKLAEKPDNGRLVPLTEFCELTPEKHDLGDGKPPLKSQMWFQVTDQPVFAVAGFWQQTKAGSGFAMVDPGGAREEGAQHVVDHTLGQGFRLQVSSPAGNPAS